MPNNVLCCGALLVAQLVCAFTPAPAAAHKLSVDTQLFVPTPLSTGFLTADAADVAAHLALNYAAMLTYGHALLGVVSVQAGGVQAPIGPVLNDRVDANLMAAIGLFDFAEIGLVLPIVWVGGFDHGDLSQNGIDVGTSRLQPVTQGDLRIVPKIRVLRAFDDGLQLAIVPTLILPTAAGTTLVGEAWGAFAPSVAVSHRNALFRAALDVGFKLRRSTVLGASDVTLGNEAFAKLGIGFRVYKHIELIGEVFGATQATRPFGAHVARINRRVGTPVEADVAVKAGFGNYSIIVGGGGGLTNGYGAPAPRVFVGASYDTSKTVLPDRDHDGIPDVRDKCPDRPEDIDGFEDEDGCPDPDNDHDNILDEDDMCPNEAEDKDGFEDEDGCPDLDNDRDGVPDSLDKCPDEPEDRDGFEDEDGCPDLDNDHDGIADALDVCPDAAEDVDGFEDDDGCPDLDNDQDGLPDLNDQCPNVPEDKDGVADLDGCPEDNDQDGIPDNLDKCPNEPETYNGFEDEDGCPDATRIPSKVHITAEKIEIKEKVFFHANSAVIEKRSHDLLNQVTAVLRNVRRIAKLRIEGHTDNTGSREKNRYLSRARAMAVRHYLIGRGIEPARLSAAGLGPDRPLASNKTAGGRDKNRRVEFVIAQMLQLGDEVRPAHVPGAQAVTMPPPSAAAAGGTHAGDEGDTLLDLGATPGRLDGGRAPHPRAGERAKKRRIKHETTAPARPRADDLAPEHRLR